MATYEHDQDVEQLVGAGPSAYCEQCDAPSHRYCPRCQRRICRECSGHHLNSADDWTAKICSAKRTRAGA